jgi:putative hemolysin
LADKFFDIEKLFREKNPRALKFLPGFIMRYLKRILHEDEMNDFMNRHANDDAFEFTRGVVKEYNINAVVEGMEHLPKEGGVIIASNHPLGGFDAMTAVPQIELVRKDIRFIVNDLLLNIKPLQKIFVGVNKHGRSAQTNLASVDELFSSDKAVFIFPAGLVSRKVNGVVADLEWKKAFITRAIKYQKPVIPMYIDGSLTNSFYRISNIRTKLGIKANIEMLYLIDEMVKQRNKTIKIVVGKPILPETFTKDKTHQQWANYVKEEVYKLSIK